MYRYSVGRDFGRGSQGVVGKVMPDTYLNFFLLLGEFHVLIYVACVLLQSWRCLEHAEQNRSEL